VLTHQIKKGKKSYATVPLGSRIVVSLFHMPTVYMLHRFGKGSSGPVSISCTDRIDELDSGVKTVSVPVSRCSSRLKQNASSYFIRGGVIPDEKLGHFLFGVIYFWNKSSAAGF
jgi:hypothetical protein